MKKLFIFLLALVASVGTMFAERVQIGDLYYNLDATNQTAEVAGSGSASGEIIIPASVNYDEITYSVTSIGNSAFEGCSGLTSVTIPNSVTNIGYAAFRDCSGLTSVTIPNSVTSIGYYAFQGCSGLTSVTIPNSVTSIGTNAFQGCTGLTSVIVEKGNTVYDSRNNCNAIIKTVTNTLIAGCKNTTIPNSVTGIGISAFSYRTSLTSIEIPNSVTSIGNHAFHNCTGLTSITIPNSVTSIGDYAFFGCSSLTSITISNSVTSIGNNAFFGCTGLSSVTNYASIPQGISSKVFEEVNKSACTLYVPAESVDAYKAADVWKEFGNILAIEESGEVEVLSIAEAIQIGMALDSMATSAETYTIEGYVINAGTFYAGTKDQNWYMADDQETASSDFQAYRCYPIDGIDTVEVRNGSKVRMTGHLQKYYDRQKALYVVEMTYTPAIILSKPQIDTITVAEALALGAELEDNASTSKQYAIRGYVSSVSSYYEQLGYQNFYIADDPNSTANTNAAGGFYVFRGIPSTGTAVNKGDLVELTCAIRKYVSASGTNIYIENSEFPVSVTVLQVASDPCIVASGTCGAQGGNLTWTLTCDSILTISGTGAMAEYTSIELVPWLVVYHEAIKSVIIGEEVINIGNYAFSGCSGLTSVTIGNSVTSIGKSAFRYCSSLTSVTMPNSVTSIGESAFSRCSSLISVTISDSVTNIGNGAFYECIGLTSIEIPNSVTNIEDLAFSSCINLASVTIPNSVTGIGENAFYNCHGLTSIIVENGNIVYDSRNNCNAIVETATNTLILGCKNTTIPNSVTLIGNSAFSNCHGLTSITIPDSVTGIGDYAFHNCSGLTSITIPANVTSIGNYAFAYCDGLTSFTNNTTKPQVINANVFSGVNKSTCTLYVPAESVEAYKAADVWKDFVNILPIEGNQPVEPTEGEFNILYVGQDGDSISSEEITLHLPVAPTIEGFIFLKWQVVAGDLIDQIVIQAVYTVEEPTSAPAVYTNPTNPAQKLIRNGNVYILTEDKIYTIQGQMVK